MDTKAYNHVVSMLSDEERAMQSALQMIGKLIDHALSIASFWWHDQDDLLVQALYMVARRVRDWQTDHFEECAKRYPLEGPQS